MRMPDYFFRQTAILRSFTSQRNGAGEPVFTDRTIRVSWTDEVKKVQNNKGDVVISNARMYYRGELKPDDRVIYNGREWLIHQIYTRQDMFGKPVVWEARV